MHQSKHILQSPVHVGRDSYIFQPIFSQLALLPILCDFASHNALLRCHDSLRSVPDNANGLLARQRLI